ncbi:MAG: UDP-3-O-(3-hydroxymyristoyl)glucosamine N-acyltransferase [Chitinophagaceae bacterium]|nr:UDP-3-O-(3-hydroxymyristoyl)glucosamine N-acyltransferase [Chitinophagaceae bacterium]
MQFPSPVAATWLANLLDAEVLGNTNAFATGINEIHKVEVGDVCFVDHPKYYSKCLNSAATFIIINNKEVDIPTGKTLLVCAEPFEAYLKIVNHFQPFEKQIAAIHPSAKIGDGTYIMPQVFIGNHVKIGKNCTIYPHVSILDYTEIGDNVIIQSNTVIGGHAFYYNTKKNREVWYKRMVSCGKVVIEDDVEIGATCTIDRGVTASTIIGKGTKMDNSIHVGHDTVIGSNCLIAAHVVIAGGVIIENGVTLWGQVVVNKTLTIGENAVVLGMAGVVGSIEGNKTYWGVPAQDAAIVRRELIWIKRIPELWKKVMG